MTDNVEDRREHTDNTLHLGKYARYQLGEEMEVPTVSKGRPDGSTHHRVISFSYKVLYAEQPTLVLLL